MLKEEMIVEALSKNLRKEKLETYLYAGDLKANHVWIWVALLVAIILVVLLIQNDLSLILCALMGGIVGGYLGYNKPTYLGLTDDNHLLICKVKLDNKTPRYSRKIPLTALNDIKIKTNAKSGKNILRFKYNGKEFEYIYFRKVANKNLSSQYINAGKFNEALKKAQI